MKYTLLLLCCVPAYTFAQKADSVKVTELMSVEVRAVRAGAKSPFAATTLGKKEIQQQNDGRDLPYVLDQTPSVLVSSDAGTGIGYTDMRIRGTDGQRINFTINGIPINDAESQGTFFVDFPDLMSSANSIQVQRGVGSSTNGSGAFGGSVNISNIAQQNIPTAELINSIGSFNTFRHTLNAGTGRLKGGFNFDVRLSKIKSDGYIDRSNADLKSLQFLSGWTSKNQNTNIKFNLFTGTEKTGQAWNGVSKTMLDSIRTYNELGIKEDGKYYNDQTDNYRQDYYQFFVNHNFNAQWKLNTALYLTRGIGYYNEYKTGEKYKSYNLPNYVVGNDTITKTSLIRQLWLDNYNYGGVFGLHYSSVKTQLTFGGAFSQYDGKHYGFVKWTKAGGVPNDYKWYDDIPAYKTDVNIYGKLEQEIARNLYAYIDLQGRMVRYKINGFRKNPSLKQDNNYLFFNPKAGLTYIKDEQKAYLSFAIANKEPNRNDFEAGEKYTPKRERLYDIELGYQYGNALNNIGLNLYYMFYQDQLVATGKINDVGAYTRTNVDKSFRAGAELFAKYNVAKWLEAQGNFTFSQNKIDAFTEYIDDYDKGGQKEIAHRNTDIAFSPNIIAGGTLSFRPFEMRNQQQFTIDVIGKFVGRQYLDNTSNKDKSIAAYALSNISATYTAAPKWIRELRIIATVNNLLNKKYESKGYTYSYIEGGMKTFNYYYPQAGTNFMMTLALGF